MKVLHNASRFRAFIQESASSHRAINDPDAAAALSFAIEKGPDKLMDFLVHLTCAEEPGKDNLAQEPARVPAAAGRLLQIQEIADEQYKRELIAQKGADVVIDPRASICFANIPAPTAETEFEFVVQAEEEYLQSTGRLGSLVMYLHAYPRAWVLAYSTVSVWIIFTLIALVPALAAPFVCAAAFFLLMKYRQFSEAALRPPETPRPYMFAIICSATSVGAFLFATRISPEVSQDFPMGCAVLGLSFLAYPISLYLTTSSDPGFVPKSTLHPNDIMSARMANKKICETCMCIRPLRAKHDPFSGYCVRRFDHYCPIVDNAVGEGNQGYFFMVLASMLTGQLLFLRLGWAYLERVAPIPREGASAIEHLWTSWTGGDAQIAAMWFFQVFGVMFNLTLNVRATFGMMQNLTANEMQNWRRYEYLHDPHGGRYRNPFDRGVAANTAEFFAKAFGGNFIDWDARYEEALETRRKPPALSFSNLFEKMEGPIQRLTAWLRARRARRAAGGHGHSHNGVPCDGNHGAPAGGPMGGMGHNQFVPIAMPGGVPLAIAGMPMGGPQHGHGHGHGNGYAGGLPGGVPPGFVPAAGFGFAPGQALPQRAGPMPVPMGGIPHGVQQLANTPLLVNGQPVSQREVAEILEKTSQAMRARALGEELSSEQQRAVQRALELQAAQHQRMLAMQRMMVQQQQLLQQEGLQGSDSAGDLQGDAAAAAAGGEQGGAWGSPARGMGPGVPQGGDGGSGVQQRGPTHLQQQLAMRQAQMRQQLLQQQGGGAPGQGHGHGLPVSLGAGGGGFAGMGPAAIGSPEQLHQQQAALQHTMAQQQARARAQQQLQHQMAAAAEQGGAAAVWAEQSGWGPQHDAQRSALQQEAQRRQEQAFLQHEAMLLQQQLLQQVGQVGQQQQQQQQHGGGHGHSHQHGGHHHH